MGVSKIDFCFACNDGKMININPVHSYDFNKDGWVPKYCNVCGETSDSDIVAIHKMERSKFKKLISNRKLKRILWNVTPPSYGYYRNQVYEIVKDDKSIISIPILVDKTIKFFESFGLILKSEDVFSCVFDVINT